VSDGANGSKLEVGGSTLLRLMTLAWPIIVQRATQSVVGLADALMVAPLGEEALAAVTTGAFDTFAVTVFPMGTVFIVQSFASQLHGRGEIGAARRYAWYGLWLAVIAGVLSMALVPFVPGLIGLLGYSPLVAGHMATYMVWRLPSVGLAVATEALVNWYGGLGNTRLGMVCGLTAMVVNVMLNYTLIEPRFGLPGYGVAGAAVASSIATGVGLIPAAWYFFSGRGFAFSGVTSPLRLAEFRRMLKFGLPNGVNWFLEFGAFMMFVNLVVGHLGTTALAAFNVVMQLSSVAFMPAFGASSAGAILVGEALGRGDKDRVPQLVKMTAKVTATWMVTVGLTYLLFPQVLLGLFQTEGSTTAEDFVAVGTLMLTFGCFWQCFDAAAMTVSEALRAAGDTAWPMWARIVLAWGLFFPGGWLTVVYAGGGVAVTMSWVVGYLALLAIVLVLRFLSGRWRYIQLVEEVVV
jgi:MATE family multidrug resistance protein